MRYHHFCTILPTNLYASRSFLISYDLDNGEDRDLSKEHLILSTENVCGFSFYSAADPGKSVATAGGGSPLRAIETKRTPISKSSWTCKFRSAKKTSAPQRVND